MEPKVVTPNMHLNCHLKEPIENFGPLHAFWLFSYETFNGVLGSYQNNNKSIVPQLMNKFSQENPPSEFVDDFNAFCG